LSALQMNLATGVLAQGASPPSRGRHTLQTNL
jgi:hypothetical protein